MVVLLCCMMPLMRADINDNEGMGMNLRGRSNRPSSPRTARGRSAHQHLYGMGKPTNEELYEFWLAHQNNGQTGESNQEESSSEEEAQFHSDGVDEFDPDWVNKQVAVYSKPSFHFESEGEADGDEVPGQRWLRLLWEILNRNLDYFTVKATKEYLSAGEFLLLFFTVTALWLLEFFGELYIKYFSFLFLEPLAFIREVIIGTRTTIDDIAFLVEIISIPLFVFLCAYVIYRIIRRIFRCFDLYKRKQIYLGQNFDACLPVNGNQQIQDRLRAAYRKLSLQSRFKSFADMRLQCSSALQNVRTVDLDNATTAADFLYRWQRPVVLPHNFANSIAHTPQWYINYRQWRGTLQEYEDEIHARVDGAHTLFNRLDHIVFPREGEDEAAYLRDCISITQLWQFYPDEAMSNIDIVDNAKFYNAWVFGPFRWYRNFRFNMDPRYLVVPTQHGERLVKWEYCQPIGDVLPTEE